MVTVEQSTSVDMNPVGDLVVVAPVGEECTEYLHKLTAFSMLIVAHGTSTDWLNVQAGDEKYAWSWVSSRGDAPAVAERPLRLAFAARTNCVPSMSILGSGCTRSGMWQWAVCRFELRESVGGLSSLTIGAVLAQRPSGAQSRSWWTHVAEHMVQHHVRVIAVMALPMADVKEAARRLRICLVVAMSSAVAENKQVRHALSAYGDCLHYLVLGKNSGFGGPLCAPAVAEEGKQPTAKWKAVLRSQAPAVAGTMDMVLPPALCKYLFAEVAWDPTGLIAAMWFKGQERRSAARMEHLHIRDVLRSSNAKYRRELASAVAEGTQTEAAVEETQAGSVDPTA